MRANNLKLFLIGSLLLLLPALRSAAQAPQAPQAPGEPPPDPAHFLAQAAEQVRIGAYSAGREPALTAANQAADPAMKARALLLAGYCEYRLSDFAPAREHLREASQLYPFISHHALFYGARSFQEEGQYDEAVKLWERLLAAGPPGDLPARGLMELLRCHRERGDAAGAGAALARLGSVAGKDPEWDQELEFSRGWVKAGQGDQAGARAILKQLWKDEPASSWAARAETMLTAPGPDGLALPGESPPFSRDDRMDRIRRLQKQGDPGQALDEFDPIVKAAEEKAGDAAGLYSLYKFRGELSMDKRRFNNAIADFKRAEALAPGEDVELTYLIARSHQRDGDHAEAIALFRHLYTDYPGGAYTTRALYYSARLMKLDNDWEGALTNYQKLVTGYPNSSLRPESLFQLGWIKYLQGDYGKALMYLEQVPEAADDKEFNLRTYYWKSALARKTGQDAKAAAAEDYILRHDWKSCYAYYLVMMEGRAWPYGPGGRPVPAPPASFPAEYGLARELYLLGMTIDAEGQLDGLAARGGFTEDLAWPVAEMYRDLGDYYNSQRLAARQLKGRLKSPPPAEAEAWRLAYPRAYPDQIASLTREYGLDPYFVWSLMRAESTYRPVIKSSAGARGLMQIMPDTGRAISSALGEKGYSADWLNDPNVNMRYGCFYLANRMKEFARGGGPEARLHTVTRALASYNAGPNRVKRWGDRADQLGLSPAAFVEEIPIQETRDYVKKILGFYLVYYYSNETPPAPAPGETVPVPKSN